MTIAVDLGQKIWENGILVSFHLVEELVGRSGMELSPMMRNWEFIVKYNPG